MGSFLIKKTFFDMWDNLYKFMLINLGYIVLIVGGVMLPGKFNGVFSYLTLFTIVTLIYIYTGAVSHVCKMIAEYNTPTFDDFFKGLRLTYKTSFLFGFLSLLYFTLLIIVFRVYNMAAGSTGLIIVGILFWINVLIFASLQFFFCVQSQLDKRFIKILKKSAFIFFDNTPLAIGLMLGTLVIMMISVITLFFLFGVGFVVLWYNVALRLLMLKYDYFEANPETNRKKVPWNTILKEEKERVGKRTFKNFIFPWKD